MMYQRRAALISLAIHGAFIAAMTGIAAFTVPAAPTFTIDFSIKESPVPPPAVPVSPPPEPTHRQTRKPAPPPVVEEVVAFPDTTMEDTAVDTAQFAGGAEPGEIDDLPAQVTSIGPIALPRDTGQIREHERQRYLKEQFEYIRNIIYRKATYPPMALEMNITGTVVLSFCVREDGGVENIDILKGSGASVLDRDAVATVKRAAPFPRPPVQVVVKFPLEYRLE